MQTETTPAAKTATDPRRLAGLIGPSIMVVTASEAMRYNIWDVNIPAVTYLNGTLLFVGGLAIVRAHNRWTRRWPVLITLTGWAILFFGLIRMFAPEAKQPPESPTMYAGLAVLFAMGSYLTYKGYGPEERRNSSGN